jgi:membrane-associated phospholipid phosphatase
MDTWNDFRRTRFGLLLVAGMAAALTIAAVFAVDGPLAIRLATLPRETRDAIQDLVRMLEVLFAFPISRYLYGVLLLLGSLLAFRLAGRTPLAWTLLFIGLSHVTARFVAGIVKVPFSRLRPFEALGSDGWHDTWFAAVGNSFPSGHAAHFWSLFFPLAVLFPRYTAPLAILPLLVSAARIAVNDHYLADVLASVSLAAIVTWTYVSVLERGARRTPGAAPQPTAPSRA